MAFLPIAATLVAMTMAPAGALARPPAAPGQAPAVRAVVDCQKIADGAQRLACFDAAAAAMDRAQTAGDLVTVDRAQRRAARHQAFGLALPSLNFLDRGEKGEEVNRINAKVVGGSFNPNGKLIVKLDDGAVWRQIDDNEVLRPPHPGSTAEIRRAALGSYTMKLDGQFAIRVHRDN
jgi:hypothetical protein